MPDPSAPDPLAAVGPKAWAAVLPEILPRLRSFVHLQMGGWLREQESASDVVQSTCRELLEEAGGARFASADDLRAWLFQAARNKIRERARFHRAGRRDAQRRVLDAELVQVLATITSPSEAMAGDELAVRIEAALAGLPEDYREVILLARVAGLPRRAVAAAMGRSEGSVRMLLSRALVALLAAVEQRPFAPDDGASG